ncbi:MAG: SseB family protein [Actinomycetes bacterium]
MQPTKHLQASAFAGDDGSADPALVSALRAHAADDGRLPEVLAALHRSRVLAPVVAVLGESATTAAGLVIDKTADIALPLLDDGAGHRAVPLFSGLDALSRWDPSARPVPVEGPRAAAVALAEAAEAVVLDIAGPCPATLGHREVRALAEGRGTVPAYDDKALAHVLARVLAVEPQVLEAWIAPAAGVDARLTVAVAVGTDTAELGAWLADRLRALADHAVRGVDLALTTDKGSPPGGLPVHHQASLD